jgi:hypothetical protein
MLVVMSASPPVVLAAKTDIDMVASIATVIRIQNNFFIS